jgi:hypothetical protein
LRVTNGSISGAHRTLVAEQPNPRGPCDKIARMPERPSALWKRMPAATRVLAAEAFWRDKESPEIAAQHVEAAANLASRLKFRAKSVQTMSLDRKAKYLAQLSDISDAIATRALIAYHFANQRPLMGAFLDALGIAHEDGLITAEDLKAPDAAAVAAAATSVKASFPAEDVEMYLRTLATLDGDTWAHIETVFAPTP